MSAPAHKAENTAAAPCMGARPFAIIAGLVVVPGMVIEVLLAAAENDSGHPAVGAAPGQYRSGIHLGNRSAEPGINRMQAAVGVDPRPLGNVRTAALSEALNIGIADIG